MYYKAGTVTSSSGNMAEFEWYHAYSSLSDSHAAVNYTVTVYYNYSGTYIPSCNGRSTNVAGYYMASENGSKIVPGKYGDRDTRMAETASRPKVYCTSYTHSIWGERGAVGTIGKE